MAHSLFAQAGDPGDHLAASALRGSLSNQPMKLDSGGGKTGLEASDILGCTGELIQRVLERTHEDLVWLNCLPSLI